MKISIVTCMYIVEQREAEPVSRIFPKPGFFADLLYRSSIINWLSQMSIYDWRNKLQGILHIRYLKIQDRQKTGCEQIGVVMIHMEKNRNRKPYWTVPLWAGGGTITNLHWWLVDGSFFPWAQVWRRMSKINKLVFKIKISWKHVAFLSSI